MGAIETLRDALFGNPPSPSWEPSREGVLAAFTEVAYQISSIGLGASTSVVKATRALIDADLAHNAGAIGLVYNDATDANNDLYVKLGASGAGSWQNTGALHQMLSGLAAPYVYDAEQAAIAAAADAVAAALSASSADASSDSAAASALAAENARQATESAAQASGYRALIADAIADFAVGEYFYSDDQGDVTTHPNRLRLYKRIAVSPFYEDMGDEAAPLTKGVLNGVGGADEIGKAGGGTVQDFFDNGEIDALTIPPTTDTGDGVIYQDGVRLFHTYNDGTVVAGHVGGNAFGGLNSGNFTLSGVDNTGFGQDTLTNLTSASLSTMFGTRAGRAITSGGVNSGFGVDALASCTTGEYNDGFGCKALTNTTVGSRNKAFGQSTLLYNITGDDNCAHGQEALIANLSGNRNNAYGNFSQYTSTDKSDNCSYGTNSLRNNAADQNSAFGNYSFYSNTTGTLGCAFGSNSLYSNTTGSQNAAFGPYSLYGNTSGGYNAAFGHRAGYGAAGDEATTVDTYCTFLGPYASRSSAVPTATVLTNSTAVGNDAKVTKSNQVVLGNASVTETIVRGVIRGTALTFAALPTASSAGAGARSFITDCNATTFAAVAAAGGSNGVPVYSDGTNWRIG